MFPSAPHSQVAITLEVPILVLCQAQDKCHLIWTTAKADWIPFYRWAMPTSSVLLLNISPLSWSPNPLSFSSLQPLGAAPSNMVVGNHVWLFVLKWIKSRYKKVNPQLHQLHFKPSVASGCHTGRPSSTGLMICSLLSVQGNFPWQAFGQVPSHNFSDSQCDLQAPGPSGTCLALCSAPPCLLPCHHILHSFIPFNLSLSLQNTAHCPCILLHTSDLAQAPFTGFLQVNLLITLQSLWPPTVCAPVRAQMVLITCC